ncbi:tRNA (cytosine(34)-C(5))-methyltransferase [Nymphon striatum]|nr:tRNA (cytosine(34)-C(5))-methyltransferase [Nymphon striatum]
MPRYRKKRNRGNNRQEPGVKTSGDTDKGHVDGIRGSGYADIIKSNPRFETFYRAQNIVPEDEWDEFMETLKQSLPATFRITGYKSHASALLGIIKSQYFSDLINSYENEAQCKPRCLSWYPNNLGWQLNLSRIIIRKSESLAKLHTFLVGETESGNISRQEAVSMIPPLVLNVKSHHKVLDLCAAPGSKTAQLIEMLHNHDNTIPEGVVVANDMDNKRCYMLVHQTKRLQSPCFLITNHDATIFPKMKVMTVISRKNKTVKFKYFYGIYSYIITSDCSIIKYLVKLLLFDSGDGTLRKNYEVWRKWNVGNANNLHHIQMKILKRGLEMLAVGGRLVYSTCSLNPVENEAVVAATIKLCQGSIGLLDVCKELPGLKTNPGLHTWKIMNKDLQEISSAEEIPEHYLTQIKPSMFPPTLEEAEAFQINRCIRILPHHQDTGCFFVAVIEKKGSLPWQKVSTELDAEAHEDEVPESVEYSRKKRKPRGYKEDPFFFFKENEPVWTELKNFYEMEDFPDSQLLTRCETGKKRNIYFVSNITKNILQNNDKKIKIINSGLRLFCRSDNKGTACEFRVTQEGVSTIMSFVKTRIIEITKEDLTHLLTTEYPPMEKMCAETRERADKFGFNGDKLKFELCAWKGKASLRCYVPRGQRLHYLRLCDIDISKYVLISEINPNKKFKVKSSEGNEESNENDDENNDKEGDEDDINNGNEENGEFNPNKKLKITSTDGNEENDGKDDMNICNTEDQTNIDKNVIQDTKT